MRALLVALAVADLAIALVWAVFWLRERHLPRAQRVRTTPYLTPLLVGIFLAQAVLFWLNATNA